MIKNHSSQFFRMLLSFLVKYKENRSLCYHSRDKIKSQFEKSNVFFFVSEKYKFLLLYHFRKFLGIIERIHKHGTGFLTQIRTLIKLKLPFYQYNAFSFFQKEQWQGKYFNLGKACYTQFERTIMLVGATGSGKSTLVDGIINYILDVNFEDFFRFKMVVLEEEEMKTTNQVSHYSSNFI